jgi:hypothetical protein
MRFSFEVFMKIKILSAILLVALTLPLSARAFVLISPDYKLANPTDTVVNIASNTCGSNIPNDLLLKSIEIVVYDFWNTVTESKLRFRVGGVVEKTTLAEVDPGEVLVGCNGNVGSNGGVTNSDEGRGTAIITLDAGILSTTSFDRLVWVVAHEMGHAVGLAHSGDPASIMTYNAHGWGPRPEHLSQDDKNGVIYLYPIEGQLGGLIPGCSVKAAAGSNSAYSIWLALMQELVWVLAAIALSKTFSKRRKS